MRVISTIVLTIFVASWSHTIAQVHDVSEGSKLHVHDEHHDHSLEVSQEGPPSVRILAEERDSNSDRHEHNAHAHFSTTIFRNTTPFKVAPVPATGILTLIQSWSDTSPKGLTVPRGFEFSDPLKPIGLLTTVLRR